MKSLKSVQTIAKVLSVFAKIGFVFTVIGAACSLISGSMLVSVPMGEDEMFNLILSETGVKNTTELGVILVAESVFMVGIAISSWYLCRYYKNELADGTPFTHRGAKELLKVGVINIVVPLVALVISSLITESVDVESMLSNQYEVISGLTMIFLSYLFHYGADLVENQKSE